MYNTYIESFMNIYHFSHIHDFFKYVTMLIGMYIQLDTPKYILSYIRSTIHMYHTYKSKSK
jgi:hypothetical protein